MFDAEPKYTIYQRKTRLFGQDEEQDMEQDAQQSEKCEYILSAKQARPSKVPRIIIDV